jgi:uncharacterized protein (TIGR03435 family)
MQITTRPSSIAPLALGVGLLAAAAVAVAAEAPKVGDRAPAITLEAILQAPAKVTPTTAPRSGRVTVMDFWATWCAPCIASFPHMNALAAELKNDPVDFLLITDESVKIAQRFLQTRKLQAWIGFDTDRDVFQAYDIQAIPRAVVIGTDGRIVALTKPELLTAGLLRDVAAGRAVSVEDPYAPPPQPQAAAPVPDAAPAQPRERTLWQGKDPWASGHSFLRMRIQDHEGGAGPTVDGNEHYEAVGRTLRGHLSAAFDHREGRIRTSSVALENRYSVLVRVPIDQAASRAAYAEARKTGRPVELPASVLRARERKSELLREALVATFDLDVRREAIDADVYVLKRIPGVASKVYPADRKASRKLSSAPEEGIFAARNWQFGALAQALEDVLGMPVLDETGLEGNFDWDMQYTPGDQPSIVQAAREQLGLALEPAVRKVEFLIVERAGG